MSRVRVDIRCVTVLYLLLLSTGTYKQSFYIISLRNVDGLINIKAD